MVQQNNLSDIQVIISVFSELILKKRKFLFELDDGYHYNTYIFYFMLFIIFFRANKMSCKAEGEPMSIIFTTDGQIREQSQKNNQLSVLFSAEMPRIIGLDVLLKSKMIYFSTESISSIHRIDLNAQTRHFVDNVGQPQKLALDWATENVYFYNIEPHAKSVSVCNFQAMCAPLIKVDAHMQVSALAIDSVNKYLFIALRNWWVFNSPTYVIYRYNLDGTDEKELVGTTTGKFLLINFHFCTENLTLSIPSVTSAFYLPNVKP